ncbi:tyrosine-type recombinase/integrase [Paenibacillus medicaginis]
MNNVVAINQNGANVYEDIMTFLAQHRMASVNTNLKYERNIRDFFMYIRNKEIENLSDEDLNIRNADVVKYQAYLQQIGLSNNTINSYLAAISSLYDFLEVNEYPLKAKTVKVKQLPDDSKSYGKLSMHEAETMAQLAKEQVKGQEKSALIRLAYTTSFRKSELLSLEWDDIVYNAEQNVYIVTVIGKGQKKHSKPISVDMHNELLKIKEQAYYTRYNDNKIFHLSKTTVQDMIEALKQQLNISEQRNVAFHSLRNVLANYIKETEGDIFKIKQQLGHSVLNTSMKYIDENNDNYAEYAGIQIENKIDDSIFDELSHEELLGLVKGMGNGVGLQLKVAAKKIVEGR